MSLHVELTIDERRAVLAALDTYLRVKRPERMLTSHKQTTPDGIKTVLARYDTLFAIVESVQTKLAEDS